ncbi:putative nrps-like enzyme protein [Podospora australis]|uniref:Nrps-like enzyme protein n=1 Tax=Podospora australis TaxID=1536484 RepID=A0AAN6WZ06_9PEZI|nr:putative nrps-like enzyme protein [Podospora australis]
MARENSKVPRWQNDLLPHVVDRLAKDKPDAIYGLWPVSPPVPGNGFRSITYAQLANIVNGLAWWLSKNIGSRQEDDEIEVLTYIGPNDVRLTALVLAAVKTGYVIFLPSPRNSPEAHRSLLGDLKSKVLITPDPAPPSAVTVMEAVRSAPLRHLTIPSLEQQLEKTSPVYVFDKKFHSARWKPLFIVHTSGSTGIPKPKIWTHETAARQINMVSAAVPEGTFSIDHFGHGKRAIVTAPQFHGAGLLQYLMSAIPFGTVIIAPISDAIITAQVLVDTVKAAQGADVAMVVPSVVAELAQDPELLDYCAQHLKLIVYVGGDLPEAVGNIVAKKINLRSKFGASEIGIPQQLVPVDLNREGDWRYLQFHPCIGAVFEHVEDKMYELVIRRDGGKSDDKNTQPAFSIRGQEGDEVAEYGTKDLFSPHPTVPDAWRWRARADDIIVFLNGEKTNPVSMEQHIVAETASLLRGALVVGSQRLQAALLLEPISTQELSTAEQAELIEKVWPSVEEANCVAPAHARVEKSLILVTPASRPLKRAGKGTIQRSASLAEYQLDIEELYARAYADIDDESNVDTTDPKAIAQFIKDSITAISGLENLALSPDSATSFFDQGMDSLQALRLTRALRRGLYRPDISLSSIYQNPSVEQLTALITDQTHRSTDTDADLIAPLIATYRTLIHDIPTPLARADTPTNGPLNVLLTGSTGSLGTFILHSLLSRPERVSRIYCLNRGKDGGRQTQLKNFQSAGFSTKPLQEKVTFLRANLAQGTFLGLDEATYQLLTERVKVIIHNAWAVNFNLPLSAFQSQFAGLVNLFKLGAVSGSRFSFISSVSAVILDSSPEETVPVHQVGKEETCYANGYARSKYIAENLCHIAAQHFPVAVLRIGQVAGSVGSGGTWVWNPAEWFPSLVISSLLRLHCLPNTLGRRFENVDWVPVDLLGGVVTDLAFSFSVEVGGDSNGQRGAVKAEAFNVRNPKTTAWAELIPVMIEFTRENLGYELQVVASETWLRRLEESVDRGSAVFPGVVTEEARAGLNPAVKLLDFYRRELGGLVDEMEKAEAGGEGGYKEEGQGQMIIARALAASSVLREVEAVKDEWVRKWVAEWMANVKF